MALEPGVITDRLGKAKQELLDLTLRNRLLNTPRKSKARNIEIVGERAEDVFRLLVKERKSMSFLPRPGSEPSTPGDDEPDSAALFQPDETDEEATERYTDDRLQTALTSEGLQKRLLGLFYDAKTHEEEQGVNILYLAVGFLKWFEADCSEQARFAPLLLLPVELSRKSANAKFRIRWREEDIATNLSLQAKLFSDFGIRLPDVIESDDFSPAAYFEQVASSIEGKDRWEVVADDMVLWFFSFTKFLMYRDLDPANWPEDSRIDQHPLISGLLGNGFRPLPPFCSNTERLDNVLDPLDLTHVVDADSSQTVAIEEVRRGQNLVIQGPPGTGKSQTIANLIATAVRAGKKVLFVAEKMAALDVVKRRLDNIGLGDICLELHSHKANKRLVLQELERTLALGQPKQENVEQQAANLARLRDRLNLHVDNLHGAIESSAVTPYMAIGELCRLQAKGIRPPDFRLSDSLTWSPTDLTEKKSLLLEVARHIAEIGTPAEHPWRGVMLESCLPTNLARLQQRLPDFVERLHRLISAMDDLAAMLRQQPGNSAADCASLARLGRALAMAPDMDRVAMGHASWENNRAAITELLKAGLALTEAYGKLEPSIAPSGWQVDMSEARRSIAAHGRSWFRIFNRRYRQSIAALRGILKVDLTKKLDERLQILDTLAVWQQARQQIEVQPGAELGTQAFGHSWRGAQSDWPGLQAIEKWETQCRADGIASGFRQALATLKSRKQAAELVQAIGADLKKLLSDLRELFQELALDLPLALGCSDVNHLPLRDASERLCQWQANLESLTSWIAFRSRWAGLNAEGMGQLPAGLFSGAIDPASAEDRFLMAYYESLIAAAFDRRPGLAVFDGKSHTRLREDFQSNDELRIELARLEVALAHYQSIPTGAADLGELGIIKHEINKRKNHKPIRRLIKEAGRAIQAIKPVFMMSPMSIAQFLEPESTQFDLLLIDEASQVRPEDALGAVARAGQMVVVGDDKQLPPTQFFNGLNDAPPSDDETDDYDASDLDSVLALCKSQQVPERMLRWHYRSRHQSLIAVSNHEFYDDQLFVVPSPLRGASQGLVFHHIREGLFDRGRSATNRVEARAVAEAVMQHARQQPHVSLGVGAFSVSQRDAILDELELLRRNSKDTEAYFLNGGAEPFFVKNLENIQGDEREVIFISVGYARDKSGFLAMNFGPLSNKGGERRLNVLISRARTRCEVFSSITADDIDLARATAVGAKAFKAFLRYAETGYLDVAASTNKSCDSEFERQVAQALVAQGHQVELQVGVAGFFVDLAVIDPEKPGRYVLGIECDGAQYHSSRSARDRDRLRQQVLEDRGWIIHRIWSTDWFNRPQEQLAKTVAAIETAKSAWTKREDELVAAGRREDALREERAAIQREQQQEIDPTVPYQEADFAVGTQQPIPDMPLRTLMGLAVKVVQVEGPVHADEIARRLAALCGAARTGSRISQAVKNALAEAVDHGQLVVENAFYHSTDQTVVPIRNREAVKSSGLKKPEMLPPAELQRAIFVLIDGHLGVAREEAVVAVARMLGFKSTSGQLREVIWRQIEAAIAHGKIAERNGTLQLAETEPAPNVVPLRRASAAL
jgi:very-short-patch-repair endonuclease